MRRWRVHKARGTCKIVTVEAERMRIAESGVLVFENGTVWEPVTVIAYGRWAWKTVVEEVDA